jgi:hypothetical protein
MENRTETDSSLYIIDGDLNSADTIIEELDGVIQTTGNMELSKTLNEISDTYEVLRQLLKAGDGYVTNS